MKKNLSLIISFITLILLTVILIVVVNKKEKSVIPIEKSQNEVEKVVNEKPNIYLFWGDGCGACRNLKAYLQELDKEIGRNYNLILYEIWYNDDNRTLMEQVSKQLNETNHAVPYLIIGDESIVGFNNNSKDYIKKKIMEFYTSNNYFDIMDQIKSED